MISLLSRTSHFLLAHLQHRQYHTPLQQSLKTVSTTSIKNTILSITGVAVSCYTVWKSYLALLKWKILHSTYPVRHGEFSPHIKKGSFPIMPIVNTNKRQKTLILCGSSGTNKTEAIRDSLKNEKGVVSITFSGHSGSAQRLTYAITQSLGMITNKDIDHTEAVMKVLKVICAKPEYAGLGHPPVLVVEVDEQLTSTKALQELSLTLKDWGLEKGLICPIMVLSTSRATVGLQSAMYEVRAEYTSLGDFTNEEAKAYIEQLFKQEGANKKWYEFWVPGPCT